MYVIRPIAMEDYDTFVHFAFQGEEGISSLSKNKDILKKKIESSLRAFAAEVDRPVHELYLFVLENTETSEVGGVCGICSKTGVEGIYFFAKEKIHKKSLKGIPQAKDHEVLTVLSHDESPTELCTLYLDDSFRHSGLGRLLSLSRLLFMAAFPHRFDPKVFADMRGYFDEKNVSPFYEGVLHPFVNIEREELDKFVDKQGSSFWPYVLPDYPIYIALLPKNVQECIGKVHPHTEPALKMLQEEGFQLTGQFDLIDGGPWISAKKENLRTIRESNAIEIGSFAQNPLSSDLYLLSNDKIDFRACYGQLVINEQGTAVIEESVAKALKLAKGHIIRYILPRKKHEDL